MNYPALLLSGGILLSLAACSSDKGEDTPVPPTDVQFAQGNSWEATQGLPEARTRYEPIPLTEAERTMIVAQNDFALDLFRGLSAESAENTLLSPVSLSLDLGMLSNGAAGRTLADIAVMTGIAGKFSLRNLNTLNRKLIEGLISADRSSRISVANSIWIESGYDVMTDFIEQNRAGYYAAIYRRDLSAVSTMEEINTWIARNTQGIIPSMLSQPFSEETRLTLANALYFYGSWVNSFDKSLTRKAPFTCMDGSLSQVDMMRYSENTVMCAYGEKLRAVYLPFGNKAYQMTFILPDRGVSLQEAKATLTADGLLRLESMKKEQFAPLEIPRFEVKGDLRLKNQLDKMGYGNMFTDKADFSLITPNDRLYVNDILQKAVVKVDEEGAEGAAATLIVMDSNSGMDDALFFNRPFIFTISETSSGAILFVGDVKTL